MQRTLLLVLCAGFFLTGCSRRTEPLEWKIKAGDPAEFQEWMDKNLRRMPSLLEDELVVCLNNIRTNTPLAADGKHKDYIFCQRIDGHTVREALIQGHELANQTSRARIANESDAVVRLLSTADTLDPAELKKRESLMNAHLAVREAWAQRLKLAEKRLRELRSEPQPDPAKKTPTSP